MKNSQFPAAMPCWNNGGWSSIVELPLQRQAFLLWSPTEPRLAGCLHPPCDPVWPHLMIPAITDSQGLMAKYNLAHWLIRMVLKCAFGILNMYWCFHISQGHVIRTPEMCISWSTIWSFGRSQLFWWWWRAQSMVIPAANEEPAQKPEMDSRGIITRDGSQHNISSTINATTSGHHHQRLKKLKKAEEAWIYKRLKKLPFYECRWIEEPPGRLCGACPGAEIPQGLAVFSPEDTWSTP